MAKLILGDVDYLSKIRQSNEEKDFTCNGSCSFSHGRMRRIWRGKPAYGREHGKAGTAVRAYQQSASGGEREKRKPHGDNTDIRDRIGEYVGCGTEYGDKPGRKQSHQQSERDALDPQKRQPVSGVGQGFLLVSAARKQVEINRRTVGKKQRQRAVDIGQGKGHGRRGVAQVTDSLADKNLVHHVVQRGDKRADDGRNGELQQ